MAEIFFKDFSRKKIIVAGHHPLDDLIKDDQKWITKRSGRYISAHVHRSTQLIDHNINNYKTQELNIGSTLDYPPQAVVAEIEPTSMKFSVVGANTQRSGFLKDCADNAKEWKINENFYKSYTRDVYIKYLFESLQQAGLKYNSIIAIADQKIEFPSGTKEGDWYLLDKTLHKISELEGKPRKYWACQAYYASEVTGSEKSYWERTAKLFGLTSKSGKDAIGKDEKLESP